MGLRGARYVYISNVYVYVYVFIYVCISVYVYMYLYLYIGVSEKCNPVTLISPYIAPI